MGRWRQSRAWWGGVGLFLLLLLARVAMASGPSYPGNVSVRTITCGATPHVKITWNESTLDPVTNAPVRFYQVFKWDGCYSRDLSNNCVGRFRAEQCTGTCPGGSVGSCCPADPYGAVYPSECVGGVCTFEEIQDGSGGPWYYAVLALDTAGNISQTPSVCNSPYTGGGGQCDLVHGCTPYPCMQCTYNSTAPCTVPYYCDTSNPKACDDISACLTGTTVTTTSTTSTSTTTTLVSACASPTVVPAGGGPFQGTTSGDSTLQGSCGSSGTSPEKVYQWTPSISGQATIQTCGGSTNFDTVLYIRASSCSSGTELTCNDDGPCACG